jgi:hypothetical protein
LQNVGLPDKEKLCSIQEFIPNMTALFALIQDWIDEKLSDEEVLQSINQNDFEDAMIFIWLIFDNDAHAENIYIPLESERESEVKVYHLMKIDNGLSFPLKNSDLYNSLAFFPNAELCLSSRAKQCIRDISVVEIVELMKLFELEEAIDAFLERAQILKELARRENITFSEIDLRLCALELPEGKEIALNSMNLEELENYLFTFRNTETK